MTKLQLFTLLMLSFTFVSISQVITIRNQNPPNSNLRNANPPSNQNPPTSPPSNENQNPRHNLSSDPTSPPPAPSTDPSTSTVDSSGSTNRQAPNPYINMKNWQRSFDGTGNNAQFTNWGSTGQIQPRFCPNNYVNKLQAMQTNLPNPR